MELMNAFPFFSFCKLIHFFDFQIVDKR